ncbi:MAG: hypothetical protein AAGE92_02885 [Cyanobacteria bacterium P01_G01_bin.4]
MKFHCTYCGHGIETADNSIGHSITCPSCNAELQVPPPPKASSSFPTQPSPASSDISAPTPTWGRRYRRGLLVSAIACIMGGAVALAIALLEEVPGDNTLKIALTVVSLGIYSLTALCCASLAEKRSARVFKLLSSLGIAASVVGAVFAILTNWEFITGWEILLKGRISFLIIALAFSHASLLLRLESRNDIVRIVRGFTIAVNALVAASLISIALHAADVATVWWFIAIYGSIFAVLGTIAVPLLHLATRKATTP